MSVSGGIWFIRCSFDKVYCDNHPSPDLPPSLCELWRTSRPPSPLRGERAGRGVIGVVAVESASRPKEFLDFTNYFHEPIDLGGGIVKIEARSRRRIHTELAHERLIAVMPAS